MPKLLGKKVVQTRIWADPKTPPEKIPPYDFTLTYPVTLFEAVEENRGQNARTLAMVIDEINTRISQKQKTLPAAPPNHLVRYTGAAGSVGSIEMVSVISEDSESWSDEKVPTEKAVGDLINNLITITHETPDCLPIPTSTIAEILE